MLQSQNPYSTERIDALTRSLSTMDARARQKYASDHKNDPAVVAVALNVSNILAAAERNKAMQGGAPQGTVVDKEIAGMTPPPQHMARLPEQQGIAQLQAPNLEGMADGGIAGYADGGGADGSQFDFVQRNEPVVRMADGGHIPRYQGMPMSMGGDGSVVGGNPMYNIPGLQAVQPRAQFTQQGAPENTPLFQRIMESLSSGNKERQLAMIEQKIAQGTATPEEIAAYQEVKLKAGDKTAVAAKYPDKDAVRTKDFPGVTPGSEKMPVDAGASAGKTPPPGAAPEKPQAALPTGLASIAQAKKAGEELYGSKELEGKIEQQRLQERQDIANERDVRSEKLAAFNKEQGPAMAGYSKILDAQEKEDATDKEKSGLMALFKGFLAVAAGESPNAAVNIAKGSMVGLEDYSTSLKDLKKAAKERGKERAYIEQAQRAEGREDFKSQTAYEDKANDAGRAADRHAMDAVTKVTGQKGEGAARIYAEMLQQQGANTRTNAQIAAGKGPGPTEHLYKTLGGGDVAKGLGVYANIMGPEGKGMESELQAYIKNPMMLKASNPDLAAQFDAIIKQRTGSMIKPQAGVGSRD
jgi:hypothetical protein